MWAVILITLGCGGRLFVTSSAPKLSNLKYHSLEQIKTITKAKLFQLKSWYICWACLISYLCVEQLWFYLIFVWSKYDGRHVFIIHRLTHRKLATKLKLYSQCFTQYNWWMNQFSWHYWYSELIFWTSFPILGTGRFKTTLCSKLSCELTNSAITQ